MIVKSIIKNVNGCIKNISMYVSTSSYEQCFSIPISNIKSFSVFMLSQEEYMYII